MKSKLYYPILLLLLSNFISFAQSTKDPYIPILDGDKVWYTANRGEFGDLSKTIYIMGDTEIIDGKVYTVITSEDGGVYRPTREDVSERKVYVNWGAGDFLLYDFSLEVGDSIFLYWGAHLWYDVIAIEYVETIVGLRKAWFLSSSISGELLPVWIEGIGSMAGLFEPAFQPNLNWWNFPELLCFKKDEVMEYKSINGINLGCELEFIGLTEYNTTSHVSIYPNPTNSVITINSQDLSPKIEINITDLLGKTHYKNTVFLNTSFDISFLSQGIYLLKIADENQKIIVTKKIIKL
jgi:hypothetical protein